MWRTTFSKCNVFRVTCISIHVPRVEDDVVPIFFANSVWISIHVPRVEDDGRSGGGKGKSVYFNPRPPCGGRLRFRRVEKEAGEFQSTSPVWRTTTQLSNFRREQYHFNPRPPCGGRPDALSANHGTVLCQSTAPVWRTTRSRI